MTRLTFEQKQRHLRDKGLVLGSQVEEILQDAVEALRQRDLEESTRLIADSRSLKREGLAFLSRLPTEKLQIFEKTP